MSACSGGAKEPVQTPAKSGTVLRTPSKRVITKNLSKKETERVAKAAAKAAATKLESLELRAHYLDTVPSNPSQATRGALKKKLASPGGAAKVRSEYETVLAKIAALRSDTVVPPVAPLCVHWGWASSSSALYSKKWSPNVTTTGLCNYVANKTFKRAIHDDADGGGDRVENNEYDADFAETTLDLTEAA